jgi:hypothetical protein
MPVPRLARAESQPAHKENQRSTHDRINDRAEPLVPASNVLTENKAATDNHHKAETSAATTPASANSKVVASAGIITANRLV